MRQRPPLPLFRPEPQTGKDSNHQPPKDRPSTCPAKPDGRKA
jgi:hypothetical protein